MKDSCFLAPAQIRVEHVARCITNPGTLAGPGTIRKQRILALALQHSDRSLRARNRIRRIRITHPHSLRHFISVRSVHRLLFRARAMMKIFVDIPLI